MPVSNLHILLAALRSTLHLAIHRELADKYGTTLSLWPINSEVFQSYTRVSQGF